MIRAHTTINGYMPARESTSQIFPLVYRDGEVPPAARPLAHRQIRAHLEHLADQGQLTPE
jgi:hypothetical protein